MKINFKKALEDKVKSNLKDIEDNLNAPEYKIKIKKWSQKFNFNYETILDKVKADSYFRACFAKDLLKQNIIQKIVANHIKQIIDVTKFQKLNNFNKKTLFKFWSNYQLSKKWFKKKKNDFKWKIKTLKNNKLECYAYHKYIHESGGAQDNQYRGVVNSIKIHPQTSRKKITFYYLWWWLLYQTEIRRKEKK